MAEQKNTYPERYADAEYANVNDPDMNNQEFPYQGQGYQDLGYQDLDSQQFADQDLGYQSESRYRDPRYQNSEYTDAQYQGWEYETPGDQSRRSYEREYRPNYQPAYLQRQPSRHQITAEQTPGKDLVLGLLGGVAGVIAMDIFSQQVMPLLTRDTEGEESRGQGNDQPGSEQEQPLESISLVGEQHRPNESATAALGRMLYHWATDEDPDKKTKTTLSYAVHWGYGMGQGAVYAAARRPIDGFDVVGGLTFGTALWLLGDEMVVPMLGLQGGPTASGVTNHLNRLAMHLVYGVATAATTQALRRLV